MIPLVVKKPDEVHSGVTFPETQQKSRDFSTKKSKVKFQSAFSFLPSAKMKMHAQLFVLPMSCVDKLRPSKT